MLGPCLGQLSGVYNPARARLASCSPSPHPIARVLSNLEFPCWIWRRACRPRVIGRLGSLHATSTLPQEELKLDEDFPFLLPSLLSVSSFSPILSFHGPGQVRRGRSVGQADVFPRCEKEQGKTTRKRGGERASFVFLSSLSARNSSIATALRNATLLPLVVVWAGFSL